MRLLRHVSIVTSLFIAFARADAQVPQVSRDVPCPFTYATNQTRTISQSVTMTLWVQKDFYFGTGIINVAHMGYSYAQYSYGDIADATGLYTLVGAKLVYHCFKQGYYAPPMADTTWTSFETVEGEYGQIMPRYSAEVNDCFHDDGNCDEEDDGEGGGGGQEGGGTCWLLVLADEYGNPILTENGQYIVLADLGCS